MEDEERLKYFGENVYGITSLQNFHNPVASNDDYITEWVKSAQLSLGWNPSRKTWAVSCTIEFEPSNVLIACTKPS